MLSKTGFRVCSKEDHSCSHARVARRVAEALRRNHTSPATAVGRETYDGLISAREQWTEWLADGRVRKLAIVAEAVPEMESEAA